MTLKPEPRQCEHNIKSYR